jgi:hypothetical protein
MERRKFLASSMALAGTLSLPSIARATSPDPAFMWVKFLVLDFHAVAVDEDLSPLIPTNDEVLPAFVAHVTSRFAEAGKNIAVVDRSYRSVPVGVTELQIMYATVLLDLAHWQGGAAAVVGGTLIEIYRPFPDEAVTHLLRPTAFFGATARAESVAQEFEKAAYGKLDQLVQFITPDE